VTFSGHGNGLRSGSGGSLRCNPSCFLRREIAPRLRLFPTSRGRTAAGRFPPSARRTRQRALGVTPILCRGRRPRHRKRRFKLRPLSSHNREGRLRGTTKRARTDHVRRYAVEELRSEGDPSLHCLHPNPVPVHDAEGTWRCRDGSGGAASGCLRRSFGICRPSLWKNP